MTTLAHKTREQREAIDDWEDANYQLDRHCLTAMAEKDVDAVMSCFLDSAYLAVVLWGTEMRGPEPLRAAITRLFNEYDEVKLEVDRVTEFPAGDAVIAIGQATYSLTRDGEVKVMKEVWTDVRRKVNGRWVYVLDHAELLPAE